MVVKIGLRCNFFCVGAGLSKNLQKIRKPQYSSHGGRVRYASTTLAKRAQYRAYCSNKLTYSYKISIVTIIVFIAISPVKVHRTKSSSPVQRDH